jgi:hypothetical protein
MKLLRDFLQACLYVDTNFANIKTRKGYFCHKKRVGGAYFDSKNVSLSAAKSWSYIFRFIKSKS